MEEYQLLSAKTHIMLLPADAGHTKSERKDEALHSQKRDIWCKKSHHFPILHRFTRLAAGAPRQLGDVHGDAPSLAAQRSAALVKIDDNEYPGPARNFSVPASQSDLN